MKPSYLLSGGKLDNLFFEVMGIRFDSAPSGIGIHEYTIDGIILDEYRCIPTVRDIFVVQNTDPRRYKGREVIGATGRFNVRKSLGADNIGLGRNLEKALEGDYLDELKQYLIKRKRSDRVVIAHPTVATIVKKDMEGLVGEENVRAIIYPTKIKKDTEPERVIELNRLTPGLNPDGSERMC